MRQHLTNLTCTPFPLPVYCGSGSGRAALPCISARIWSVPYALLSSEIVCCRRA